MNIIHESMKIDLNTLNGLCRLYIIQKLTFFD